MRIGILVILEWVYSPPNFFEGPINIMRKDYEMTIDNGKVEARIDADTYDRTPKMKDELHEALNDRFLGNQILSHKSYVLSKSSMCRLYPDGNKHIFLSPEPCVVTITMGTPDIIITDKDGNVISDSLKERIEKKKKLSDLVEKYRSKDLLLASLLSSYKTAVNDPDNELVHLYEIRDALSKHFGREATARKEVCISETQWKRLGRLANDLPIKQGRHRGKSVGILRDATEAELNEARNVARALIEGYLRYLERRI